MSVKLYRHNESGEVVAVGYVVDMNIKGKFSYYAIFNGQFITERLSFEVFNQKYTPLTEAPKPIVECLPHEFKHRQKVLVADCVGDFWLLGEFDTYTHGDFEPFRVCEGRAEEGVFGFKYCIPFEGNESLKGSQMQGEHGAVPKGYVPPHVPKLGD